MNGKWIFIIIGVVAGFVMASTAINAADDDITSAIEAANAVFTAKLAEGDAAGAAACYTENALLLPPGSDFVSGRKAIEAFWAAAVSAGPSVFTLTTREVEQHDDTAIEVGTYRITGKEGVLLDSGKYIVVWKQIDGDWKLHRDIWNRNE